MNTTTLRLRFATNAASKIINSLQSAIFSAMQAASENVESQVRMAASFQKLEARQSILDWLVARRISQEEKTRRHQPPSRPKGFDQPQDRPDR